MSSCSEKELVVSEPDLTESSWADKERLDILSESDSKVKVRYAVEWPLVLLRTLVIEILLLLIVIEVASGRIV